MLPKSVGFRRSGVSQYCFLIAGVHTVCSVLLLVMWKDGVRGLVGDRKVVCHLYRGMHDWTALGVLLVCVSNR